MTTISQLSQAEAVAIVGMSCRFPGARSIDEYWRNLRAGLESIRALSEDELLQRGVAPDVFNRPDYVKASGALEDSADFDARFFGFSPREADILDPQQRLFLECAWEALEYAGYAPTSAPGQVGVYGGVGASAYQVYLLANPSVRERLGVRELVLANDKDFFTTRVGYKLNLHGPSVTVQTACSTSLVAVVLACQGLLDFHCDIALAGGASLLMPGEGGYLYQEGNIFSPDGHCRAFDAQAAGTVSSSGVGVVVLKRLSEAVVDGDTIYAVIRGSAINNDGAQKVGFTAPSVSGQAQVIAAAQAEAGVSPDDISYVETHGTGTILGDPIEIAALTKAFRAGTERRNFCAIGSVKTNLGHMDTAAGVGGLIKTALALHHREIPPSLHFTRANPELGLEDSPFFVNTELRPWPTGPNPRLAGVSGFGIGGTNAHVILEEAPVVTAVPAPTPLSHLLVLSAATGTALEQTTANVATHMHEHPEQRLEDAAYTLQLGRATLPYRRILVSRDREQAIQALRGADARLLPSAHAESSEHPVAFLFPGQGGQHVGMAREVYAHEPVFRESLDQCSILLGPHLGRDLREVIFASGTDAVEAQHVLEQMAVAQPAVFAIQYALAQWWLSLGVQPQALLGHSLGEFAAACLAGVFSLEDALALVAARGRLMQSTPPGMMLAVALSEHELLPLLGEDMALAAVNSRELCVAAGPLSAAEALETSLVHQGIGSWRLRVSRASHSPMMQSVLEEFRQHVAHVARSAPKIPFISNVTGTWITAEQATDPAYWADHLRSTARFADGLDLLVAQPEYVLLEVGPGQSLTRLAASHAARQTQQVAVASLPHPADGQPELDTLLTAVGRLWLAGLPIDWARLHPTPRQRIALPTYPFERERHWIDATSPAPVSLADPLRRLDPSHWLFAPSWRRTGQARGRAAAELTTRTLDWLVLCDVLGLGERLAARLEGANQRVTRVLAGSRFMRLGERRYSVDPRQPQAFTELLEDLRGRGLAPDRVVHLWTLSADTPAADNWGLDRAALDLGFYSLLFLGQALAEQPDAARVEVTAISNQLHAVLGDDVIRPEKAALLGPCLVIPKEHPHLAWRSVDIGTDLMDAHTSVRMLDCLLDELATTPEALESAVAYRGGYRWIQTFGPVRQQAQDATAPLREHGVYLITGGLGGVGLALADYLARTMHARLALVGRSAFPERDTWQNWLERHDEDDPTSEQIRQLHAIEAAGGEVHVERADITNPDTAVALIARIKQRFGALHGVIHAAGILDDGIVQLKTPDAAARVLAPKVEGTLALAAALRDAPLDFLVLCSSVSAILGPPGQVDYCAANAFLDAFANAGAARGNRSVVSINWDAWATRGMWARIRDEAIRRFPHRELVGDDGLLPDEGAQALVRALALGLPQVVVSTLDLAARISYLESANPTARPAASGPEPSLMMQLHSRASSSATFVAPRNTIEARLVAIWQDVLGIDQIGVDDNFFALGGDSLISLRVVADATKEGLRITSKQIYLRPTIAELSSVLNTELTASSALPESAEVPLTPIQHWFFEQHLEDSHHFNQSFRLEERQRVEPALIRRALNALVAHHGALRLRYVRDGERIRQVQRDEPHALARFEIIDLTAVPPGAQEDAIEAQTAELQASLDLERGPLVVGAYFHLGGAQPSQLVIVAHHLIIDGVSWRILLEDLQTAYEQLRHEQPVSLPESTLSFGRWSQLLAAYADSTTVRDELGYWTDQSGTSVAPLPVHAGGANTEAQTCMVSAELTPAETHALLREVPRAHRARINAVLLSSLARAFQALTGRSTLTIDLEGHGREPIAEGVDLTRTVGWFTTIFPLRLDITGAESATAGVRAVREQLKLLPRQGIGYGVLRYLAPEGPQVAELRRQARPQVSFNYLGQFDQTLPDSGALRFTSLSTGPTHSPRQLRAHHIDIVAAVMDARLRLHCAYSVEMHSASTMQQLVDGFAGQLRELIAESATVTPHVADFALAGLDQRGLTALLTKLGNRRGQGQ